MLLGAAAIAVLGCVSAARTGGGAGIADVAAVDLALPAELAAPPQALQGAVPAVRLDVRAIPSGGGGPDRWSGLNTGLEGLFALALAGDYVQTLHTARPGYTEGNPILGRHPPPVLTTAYFLGAGAAHAAIARLLSSPWREVWQVAGVAVQGAAIGRNVHAGVGFSF